MSKTGSLLHAPFIWNVYAICGMWTLCVLVEVCVILECEHSHAMDFTIYMLTWRS
uniref:Uncharacterized protein n=1 Tax=Rhizophora mucronata TaxID=61149 RepID=A0A2P2Q196_RHIMU